MKLIPLRYRNPDVHPQLLVPRPGGSDRHRRPTPRFRLRDADTLLTASSRLSRARSRSELRSSAPLSRYRPETAQRSHSAPSGLPRLKAARSETRREAASRHARSDPAATVRPPAHLEMRVGVDHASHEPSQINSLPVNQQRHRGERPGLEAAAPRFLPGAALGTVGRRRTERWETAAGAAMGGAAGERGAEHSFRKAAPLPEPTQLVPLSSAAPPLRHYSGTLRNRFGNDRHQLIYT